MCDLSVFRKDLSLVFGLYPWEMNIGTSAPKAGALLLGDAPICFRLNDNLVNFPWPI